MTPAGRVGFVGLGALGLALAGNLLERGYEVVGFSLGPLEAFIAAGGRAAASGAQVAQQADIVFSCLPSAQALTDAVSGAGGLAGTARPGWTLIELSTLPLDRKLSVQDAVRAAGGSMIDCAVSGRPDSARERQALVYVSGEPADVERCRPLFDALSDRHAYVGAFGAATHMKLLTNQLLAIHVMAIAEVLLVGSSVGLAPQVIADALELSAVSSPQLKIRAPVVASGRSTTPPGTSELFFKDLKIIRDFVSASGYAAPLFETAFECFEQGLAQGHGGQDTVLVYTAALRDAVRAGAGSPRGEQRSG